MPAQSSLEYILLLAIVMVVAISVILLVTPEGKDLPGISVSESQVYWRQEATPIRIAEAVHLRPSPCPQGQPNGTSGYSLTLENSGHEPITITNITMDSAARLFCLPSKNASSGITIDPFSRKRVNVNYTTNRASGQVFAASVNFTYNKAGFTGRVQVGAKKLAVYCS